MLQGGAVRTGINTAGIVMYSHEYCASRDPKRFSKIQSDPFLSLPPWNIHPLGLGHDAECQFSFHSVSFNGFSETKC